MYRHRFISTLLLGAAIVLPAYAQTPAGDTVLEAKASTPAGEQPPAAELGEPKVLVVPGQVRSLDETAESDFAKYGFKEIHRAAWTNDIDALKKLLDQGVDANTISDENSRQSVLHVAARYAEPAMVKLLIEKGADVNAVNWNSETPLGTAMYGSNAAHVFENARLLIDAGAKADIRFRDGGSPLMITCYAKGVRSLEVVKLLMDHGANPLVKSGDEAGKMPIHYAATNGLADITAYFAEHGVDVDVRASKGMTPLLFAAQAGQLETCRVLAEHGADLRAQPLDEFGLNSLHKAVYNNKAEVARFLLEKGVPVDVRTGKGNTALHLAAESGSMDALKTLVEFKADLRAKTCDEWQELAVHRAAYFGNRDIVAFFLDAGIDVNVTTAPGSTLLTLAAEKGDIELVTLLMDRGADPKLKGAQGMTARQWALKMNQQPVVDYFESKGIKD